MNKIVIFVKAPVPGKVKTRLCPPLSKEQAAKLYRAFAQDTLELAEKVPGATVEVAYEPGDEFMGVEWIRNHLPIHCFSQQGRDLGKRLAHAFEKVFSEGAQRAVAIGSDTPHLSPGMIELAFSALDQADLALGPADDGGYYLIGLKNACPGLFRKISWSTETVLQETLNRAKELDLQASMLPMIADIDTFAEFTRLARKLRASAADVCPATKHALKYIMRSELTDETLAIQGRNERMKNK